MRIEDLLKNIDKEDLKKLAMSEKGRELVSRLSEADKKRLMEELNRLDSQTVKKKLDELSRTGAMDKILKDLKK